METPFDPLDKVSDDLNRIIDHAVSEAATNYRPVYKEKRLRIKWGLTAALNKMAALDRFEKIMEEDRANPKNW